MSRTTSISTDIPWPRGATYRQAKAPMVAFPTFKSREQFWWRQDGAEIPTEIDHLQPDTALAGGSDLRLFVHGTGFLSSSVIVFNDNEEPTTMESSGILSTGVRAGMFAVPATVTVQVKTGETLSNTLNFYFR